VEGPTLENERLCSFSRGVGGGVGQRKIQPPENEPLRSFSGQCGWWWWWCHGGVNLPENKCEPRFQGLVVASKRPYTSENECDGLFWEVVSSSGSLECN